jgi:hypothetical protein
MMHREILSPGQTPALVTGREFARSPNASRAELVMQDSNSYPVALNAHDPPAHDQLQRANPLQQKGPVDYQFYGAFNRQSIDAFKACSTTANIQGFAGSQAIHPSMAEYFVIDIQ